MPAVLCATLAQPVLAAQVQCDLAGLAIDFNIDRSQFAPALDANEPPRRQITTVRMGGTQFAATPILMGEISGFWAKGPEGQNVMLIVQADGTAVYSDVQAGTHKTGRCEVKEQ